MLSAARSRRYRACCVLTGAPIAALCVALLAFACGRSGRDIDGPSDQYTDPGEGPAPSRVLFVDHSNAGMAHDGRSWSTAFGSIQAAVDAAPSLAEIWIKAGVYPEAVNVPKVLSLYGGFDGTEKRRSQRDPNRNTSCLDAQRRGPVLTILLDPSTLVEAFSAAPGSSSLTISVDGLTLRNGLAAEGTRSTSGRGGGIYCQLVDPVVRAVIAHNTFTSNVAAMGAGLCVVTGHVQVVENEFSGNANLDVNGTHGAALALDQTYAEVLNNIFVGNEGRGYCVSDFGISSYYANNVLYRNKAGGIYIDWGHGVPLAAPAVLVNNTIVHNAGIGIGGSSAEIVNNIVAFNEEGIYELMDGSLSLRSNCVFGNRRSDPGSEGEPADYTSYSGDLSPGPTDIQRDPALIDDIHLGARSPRRSPCIDAGSDYQVRSDALDIDGTSRMAGPRVDIGADEYDGQVLPIPAGMLRVSAERDTVWANGREPLAVTATAVDSAGVPLEGMSVCLSGLPADGLSVRCLSDSTGNSTESPCGLTDGTGTARFSVTTVKTGDVELSARTTDADAAPVSTRVTAVERVVVVLVQGINTSLEHPGQPMPGSLPQSLVERGFVRPARGGPERPRDCGDGVDNDGDGAVDDGCGLIINYSYLGGSLYGDSGVWVPATYGRSDPSRDLYGSVDIVYRILQETAAANPNTRLAVVGHSQGGLIALQSLEAVVYGAVNVDAVVTLDGALGGTPLWETEISACFTEYGPPASKQLVEIWNSTTDAEKGHQGSRAAFREYGKRNDELVRAAQGRGTRVMTIGSSQDCVFNPPQCGLLGVFFRDNSSTQVVDSADRSELMDLYGNCPNSIALTPIDPAGLTYVLDAARAACVEQSHLQVLFDGTVINSAVSFIGPPTRASD